MATITIELDDSLAQVLRSRAAEESTTAEALLVEAAARFLRVPEGVSPEVMEIIHRQIATYRRVFDRLAE